MGLTNAVRTIWNRLTAGQPTGARVISTGRTTAGVYVDADQALKSATVWACVQYLSKTVAQLPWRVHRGLRAGGSEIAHTAPADYLLHQRPNAEMGSFTFRQTMMGWVLLRGNAYAEIERDMRGAPYALHPLHPSRVVPRRIDGILKYEVWNPSGGSVLLDADDVLHFRGFGDGPIGVDVVSYAAQSIGWAQATEIFGAAYFGEGMNPSGIVTMEKTLSPGALEVLKDEMRLLYKGPRGQRTVYLDNGTKFEKLSTNPNDAQFIETRQHQVAEICRWFGVPPHKVMHLLQATFSNIEHQSIEVVVDSVTPWCRIFEEEVDYKLFGERNPQNLYSKMNLRGLMRGDNASRATYYRNLASIGVLSINEIRELEDMNPIGPEGDSRFVLPGVQSLSQALTAKPPNAAPTLPAPDAELDTPPADPPPTDRRRGGPALAN